MQLPMESSRDRINRRRVLAIVSHPDADKTTITEKLLLGGRIRAVGAIKGHKSGRLVTSDWMRMEQERGISVTSSVMQFSPGATAWSTCSTPPATRISPKTPVAVLTAVDSALMVVDGIKKPSVPLGVSIEHFTGGEKLLKLPLQHPAIFWDSLINRAGWYSYQQQRAGIANASVDALQKLVPMSCCSSEFIVDEHFRPTRGKVAG